MTQKPRVLVLGATGNTGGAVARQLLAEGWPVRAVVRRRDARSEALDRLGAETVVADVYDPNQLHDAMRDARRAYFLPVFEPFMIHSAAAFAAAAREARLEQVVQMGQWLSQASHPALATRQTWLTDRIFSMIPGVAHTIVTPGMFADNYLRVIDFAALLGIYPVLTGDSRCAPVANEDMARVVVAVMADPAKHAGRSYRPTGPQLLNGAEMAEVIAQVLGNRVRPIDLPLGMFLKVARMQGVDPFQLVSYQHYLEEHKRGTFALEGGTTDVVRELTGKPAESFADTARRYAARPFARKTAGNRVRALWNLLRTPLHPGYDLARLERQWRLPVASEPRLSIEDGAWRAEHHPLLGKRRAATVEMTNQEARHARA